MKKRVTFGLTTLVLMFIVWLVWHSISLPGDEFKGKSLVRIQLQWSPQSQFIAYYVAKARGFYEQHNLEVKIIPGGFNTSPINSVVTGNADIGSATGDQVLLMRYNQLAVKAIGVVFPRSVAGFMSKPERGIRLPSDLKGKKIGYYAGFDTENLALALLNHAGLRFRTDVSLVPVTSIQNFTNDEVDAFPVYTINEPLEMRRKGVNTALLLPEQFGVEFYSDTLFTTAKFLAENREAVGQFLDATAQGWDWARTNPEEAVKILLAETPSLSSSDESKLHQQDMLSECSNLIVPGNDRKIFRMDRSRWENMKRSLVAIGKMNNPDQDLVPKLCDFSLVDE